MRHGALQDPTRQESYVERTILGNVDTNPMGYGYGEWLVMIVVRASDGGIVVLSLCTVRLLSNFGHCSELAYLWVYQCPSCCVKHFILSLLFGFIQTSTCYVCSTTQIYNLNITLLRIHMMFTIHINYICI